MSNERMYIFGVHRHDKTLDENMAIHLATFEYLTKSDKVPLHVAMNVKDERLMVMGPKEEYEPLVKSLVKEFKQVSYLEIEPHNGFKTTVHMLDNDEALTIGFFTEVHPIKACNANNWYVINDKYYIIK